ncbi:TRAP-type C4-dicarboxylate transport system, small permease component [Tistlia consotensis]|uniref:TRAP transporter small permease protein n=1 Tax=Tistlia consotensis USBA 355 TaxID=560819 RepID=A0A1Y6CDD8_9PROT|nr:TRAP-type C4-dicarboxylate transport system, small permease component [Tistlia consotensis USBA 355]SNR45352.1 TRAP-type C4-dicarboxylate transport system, small permease component [Tistlia consotensis]
MRHAERFVDVLERASDILAAVGLCTMMLIISADALGRLFGAPLQGAYEFTAYYLMVIVAFLALPRSYATGGQVRLELLEPWLARLPGGLARRGVALLSLAAFGLLLWFSGDEALRRIADRETTFGVVQWPLYLSYVWMPAGIAILILRLALDVVRPDAPRRGAARPDAARPDAAGVAGR